MRVGDNALVCRNSKLEDLISFFKMRLEVEDTLVSERIVLCADNNSQINMAISNVTGRVYPNAKYGDAAEDDDVCGWLNSGGSSYNSQGIGVRFDFGIFVERKLRSVLDDGIYTRYFDVDKNTKGVGEWGMRLSEYRVGSMETSGLLHNDVMVIDYTEDRAKFMCGVMDSIGRIGIGMGDILKEITTDGDVGGYLDAMASNDFFKVVLNKTKKG